MTEKITMPKNVQSFVDKYGGIGSKEQNSAFWKEFRKAANAYANVQAKRICDLEHALAEEGKHRNKIEDKLRVDLRKHPDSELLGDAGLIAATTRCVDALDTVTEQQDEYKAALQSADNHNHEIATKLEIVTEQRDEAREQLTAERALANRLASQLKPLLIATWREKSPSKAELAMEAWEEARK